eukprot:m.664872 g.664872  ORF g.664872 m.664872 type:complete len:187 (+) comp58490_c0_seq55:1097-1657(+)
MMQPENNCSTSISRCVLSASRRVFHGQFHHFLQLEAFLSRRLVELAKESDRTAINLFESAPKIIQQQNAAGLNGMLTCVRQVVAKLGESKIQHLLMMAHSDVYVTRLAESVTSNLKSSERSLHKIGEIKQQRSDSRQEISDTEPKLANLVKDVRRIQTELEGDISKRYDNRPVHIVGEINAVEKMK